MASVIKVDEIQNSSGEPSIIDGYSVRPGQIIEQLSGPCDGQPVVGLSGTYTWPLVTSNQVSTNAYADLNGSVISYVPPANASRVMYEVEFHKSTRATTDVRTIIHWKFFVGSTEVIYARHTREEDQAQDARQSFRWTIPIGGTDDPNTGRLSSWTTLKELKLQFRAYSATYDATFHQTNWFNGGASAQTSIPVLTITAIA